MCLPFWPRVYSAKVTSGVQFYSCVDAVKWWATESNLWSLDPSSKIPRHLLTVNLAKWLLLVLQSDHFAVQCTTVSVYVCFQLVRVT